jgi:hypothetical protein
MKIISTIVLLSIGTSTAIANNEKPKGPGVRGAFQNFVKEASKFDCDAFCRGAYRLPRDQENCKRALNCSTDMDFLQEETASPETTEKETTLGASGDFNFNNFDCNRYCNDQFLGRPSDQENSKIALGCRRGMDFLQEEAASPETTENDTKLGASGDFNFNNFDCNRYCNDQFLGRPSDQENCKIALGCRRGMDFLQEETASSETTEKDTKLGASGDFNSSDGFDCNRFCNDQFLGRPGSIQVCIKTICNS